MKIKIICILSLLFVGCSKKDNKQSIAPPSSLVNVQWNLVSIQNTKTNQINNYPDSLNVKEMISFSDTTYISCYGICGNQGKAKYSVYTNNTISLSEFKIMHLNLCDKIQWEDNLFNNLDSSYSYKINGNNLIIYSKGTYNLNFVAQ